MTTNGISVFSILNRTQLLITGIPTSLQVLWQKNILNAKIFIFLRSSHQFTIFQRGNDVEEIEQKYIIFYRCQKNASSWQMYIFNEKIKIFFTTINVL